MSAFDFPSLRAQRAGAVRFKRVWGSVVAFAGCLGASALAQTPALGAKAPDFTPFYSDRKGRHALDRTGET